MLLEHFYTIKKDILSNKTKYTYIKIGIITFSNLIINVKLNIPFYYLWGLPSYYLGKLIFCHKIRQFYDKKLELNFNGKIKVFWFRIHSIKKIDFVFKSEIPFTEISKDKLEHSINSTCTKIEAHARKKTLFLASFSRGKTFEYTKLDKGSLERLEAILVYLRGKPKFVNISENEVEQIMEFTSTINPKKMLRETGHIEHKLGLKKGNLTIDQNNGIYSFKIKKDVNKIYLLDNYIGEVKKPNGMQLPFILGANYSTGSIVVKDLIEVLHLLIAGITGSGKSVTFHSILQSLMYWNQNIAFYMLDFAEVELIKYEKFRNCKFVENDFESIKNSVNEIREELDNRKQMFRNNNVVNIKEYNQLCPDQKIPYIIFAIDEANGFKEDLEKKELDELLNPIKALLKRGRKYGIIILFAVQQTNDTDFVKSWRTQCSRLGHLLNDHIDANNLTTNKEIAEKIPKLGRGEFYFVQQGDFEIPKMKGCFSQKHDKLYEVLKEVYCEKVIPKTIEIEESGTVNEENANNNSENATNKNTSIG